MDLVFVPDFSGKNAKIFEFQLFFALCSLHEFGKIGKADDFCVHIMSVDDAPPWVAGFSRLLNLKYYVKRPRQRGGFHNKTLAFDVSPEYSHALILDTDILFVSPLVMDGFDPRCYTVSAATANQHHLTPNQWEKYYGYLGLPLPAKGYATLDEAMKRIGPQVTRAEENKLPYYNAGIFCVEWAAKFGEVWSRHLGLYEQFIQSGPGRNDNDSNGEDLRARYKISNQPAFASAIEEIKSNGGSFGLLDEGWHARWQHVAHAKLKYQQMVLLHAIGAFKTQGGGVDNRDLGKGLEEFLAFARWQTGDIRRKEARSIDSFTRRVLFQFNGMRREFVFHAMLAKSLRGLASKYGNLMS